MSSVELEFTIKVAYDQHLDSAEFRDRVISRLLSSGVTGRHQLDQGHFWVLLGGLNVQRLLQGGVNVPMHFKAVSHG